MTPIAFDNNDNQYNFPVNNYIDYNCNLVKNNTKKMMRVHEKNDCIEKKNIVLNRKKINSIVSKKMKRNKQNKQREFMNY
tara:strand:- start:1457 stop:1696 length:240 start_codon:yes stop_codon:yes gene_type:complete